MRGGQDRRCGRGSRRLRFVAAGAVATLAAASGAWAQLRAASWNVARARGDAEAIAAVLAEIGGDDTVGWSEAPAILAFQEVRATDRPLVEALVAAALPEAIYVAATYTTSPFEDGSGGAQLLLYRADLLEEVPAAHADIPTGAGRNADRWRLDLLGYDSPDASLWVYGMHLKAGGAAEDAATRLVGAQAVRADADALPAGAHVLFLGDLNLSSNAEAAYAALLAGGPAQALDPLGSGSWSGAGNAIKHTQSPRDITADELVGGGMDDRFDFQLGSTELLDGAGIALIPGTYRALGNDGWHFDDAINAGNNFYFPGDVPRSNALADALFDASDHVPVVVDYQVPAVMSAAIQEEFPTVIEGAAAGAAVLVANIAAVATPQGADVLDFLVEGFGALGGAIVGSDAAGGGVATVQVPLDASTPGFVEGGVVVSALSQAAQNDTFLLFGSGLVLRHANGSLAPDADLDVTELEIALPSGAGARELEIAIWNLGFDAGQARLDVDAVDGAEGPIAILPPLPTDIGGAAGMVRVSIDTDQPPGVYGAALTILCSDEDLPGAAGQLLGVLLSVTLVERGDPADLDGSGAVDGADLGILLGSWGRCPGCPADLDGSGAVDGADLGILLGAWG